MIQFAEQSTIYNQTCVSALDGVLRAMKIRGKYRDKANYCFQVEEILKRRIAFVSSQVVP